MEPRNLYFLGMLLAIGFAHDADAVKLNHDGTGQVLIYPYYSVEPGGSGGTVDTLLTISNNTAAAKALKVSVHEGLLGHKVLDFHLYLDAFDTWTAAITAVDSEGTGVITTEEASCTVPSIATQRDGTTPSGAPFVRFRTLLIEGSNAEARTRSGFVQVIEMGEVVDDAGQLINSFSCQELINAWVSGFWNPDGEAQNGTPGHQDVAPPGGGLSGSAWLINVLNGEAYGYSATALDDFRQSPLHLFPGLEAPNLSAAESATDEGTVATIDSEDGSLGLLWDSPIEAVSAVLTHSAVSADFNALPALNGATEIILSMPTKRHYVSAQYADGEVPIAPFTNAFTNFEAPTAIALQGYDLNGAIDVDCDTNAGQLSASAAIQVLSMGGDDSGRSPITGSPYVLTNTISNSDQGRAHLLLGLDANPGHGCDTTALAATREATILNGPNQGGRLRLSGLPVIGIALQRVNNGMLLGARGQAILSNYGVLHHLNTERKTLSD